VNVTSLRVTPRAAAEARASIEGGGGTGGGGGALSEEERWRQSAESSQRRTEFMAREFPQNPPGGMQNPSAFDVAGNVASSAGQLGLRRQIISMGYLGEMLGAITPQVWALIGAFAVLAGGVLAFVLATKSAIAIVKGFGEIMLGQLKLCYEGVMALGKGFFWLMQEAIGGTVRAVEWFGEKAVQATEWAIGAFRRMAEAGVRAYAELEQQTANTVTVMGRFGQAATDLRPELMQFAMDVSSRMRFTASEVQAAMYEAHSAVGDNVEAVKALTEASLNLAAATLTDVKPAMEFMGGIINAYHLAVSDASRVSDMFFNAIANSPARMDKLIESMRYAAPVASEMGISLRETIGTLEGFYRAGLQGAMAGTMFRQSVVSLSKETGNASKAFAAVGEDFSKFSVVHTGSLLASLEMLEQLKGKIGKTNLNDLLIQAFGTRGSFGMMTLLDVGTAQLRTYMGQLDATGTASAAAADQLNTLSGAWKLLTNVWTNFETKLIAGAVAKNFVWLIGVLNALIGVAEQSGVLAAMQGVLVSVIDTLGTLAQNVGPSLIATVRDIASQVPAVIASLGAGIAQVLPSVLGFLEWLPKLFTYAFAQIIPMLVNFGEVFIPLFIQVAGVVLPLLVDVLAQVGGAFVKFLSDNSGNIVLWFQWFAWTVESVLALLPTLVPILDDLVGIFIQWAPALMFAAVQALPLLLQSVVNIIPWLQYLAANVFPVLIQGIQWFAYLVQMMSTQIFSAFVGVVVWFVTWLMANWPILMWAVTTGLWLWVGALNMALVTLQRVLPWVGTFLNFLRTNWGPIVDAVANSLEGAFNWLADLIQLIPGVIFILQPLISAFETLGLVAIVTVSALTALYDFLNFLGGGWKNIGKDLAPILDSVKVILSANAALGYATDHASQWATAARGAGQTYSAGVRGAAAPAAPAGFGTPGAPNGPRTTNTAYYGGETPTYLVANLDLGDGIKQAVTIRLDKHDKQQAVRQATRGTGLRYAPEMA
jgi:TP901 family phage tail tape measure protein